MAVNDTQHVEFLKQLQAKYFQNRPDLEKFCLSYVMLQHLIDDVVDEPKDIRRTTEAFSLARMIWSSPLYLKWKTALDVVDELANDAYECSEIWKDSTEEWKRVHADVLRHQGYNIFFAIIYLECGRNALKEVSQHFREYSHYKHLEDYDGVLVKAVA